MHSKDGWLSWFMDIRNIYPYSIKVPLCSPKIQRYIYMRYSKLRGNTEVLKQRPQRRAKLNTVAEIPDKQRALRDVPDIWWF